eukprot:g11805.t1
MGTPDPQVDPGSCATLDAIPAASKWQDRDPAGQTPSPQQQSQQQSQQQKRLAWLPREDASGAEGMSPSMGPKGGSSSAGWVTGHGSLAASAAEEGARVVARLRADTRALDELGPPGPPEQGFAVEHRRRFQHALGVLATARRGPGAEEAILLACEMVDRHLVRFVGVEMEAASALFSILRTESASRRARAMSTKEAYERKKSAAVAIGGTAAAGADGVGGDGFGYSALTTEPQRQQKQLPLSALVAAAKSLRTLVGSAVSIECSVSSASASAAARRDAGKSAGKDGGGGSGGAGGGGRVGRPWVERLVRYMTQQCDKIRGTTTHSFVERSLDALVFELRSWPAATASAGSAPTVSTSSRPPPCRRTGASPSASAPGPLDEDSAAAGVRVSAIGSGSDAGGSARGRGKAGSPARQGSGSWSLFAGISPAAAGGDSIQASQLYPSLPHLPVPETGTGAAPATLADGVANSPPQGEGGAANAGGATAVAAAALYSSSPSPSSSRSLREGQEGHERNNHRRTQAAQDDGEWGAGHGTGAADVGASGGAVAGAQSAAAAAVVAAGAAGVGGGSGAGVVNGGGDRAGIYNEAWEEFRHSIDFWNWTLARLSGFQRPQPVTITIVDQYLGGLPFHCWAEVMVEAKLSSHTYEDNLSPEEFTRTMEAFLSRRNNAYLYHKKRSAELHGALPERPEGISLSLVSTVDTPFLMVTELPADVTHEEIAVAFRPDADVPDMIVFEEIQVTMTGGMFKDSKEPQKMPQMAALLSYRSEQGARSMRDMWDGGVLRPKHRQRLTVRFSLGLNRGCIWIGNFSGKYLSALKLINFATRRWSRDTILRPVFSEKPDCQQQMQQQQQQQQQQHQQLRQEPQEQDGQLEVHPQQRQPQPLRTTGVSSFGDVSAPLAPTHEGIGMVNGSRNSSNGRDSHGAAATAVTAAATAPAPSASVPVAQAESLHSHPPAGHCAKAPRRVAVGGGGGAGGAGGAVGLAEDSELAVRQYHPHQHSYPESVGSGSGRGRHSPVGSEGGSSFSGRSVGGRDDAGETGAQMLERRRLARSRVPMDQDDDRYVRLLDVDSAELYQAVFDACDRIGSYRVVGWCKRRWLMDVLFERPRDAAAAVDDIDHLHLASARSRRPIKTLIKPADFEGGFSRDQSSPPPPPAAAATTVPASGAGTAAAATVRVPATGMLTPDLTSEPSAPVMATPLPVRWSLPPPPLHATASPLAGGQRGGAAAVALAAAEVAAQVKIASQVPDNTLCSTVAVSNGGGGEGASIYQHGAFGQAQGGQRQQQPSVPNWAVGGGSWAGGAGGDAGAAASRAVGGQRNPLVGATRIQEDHANPIRPQNQLAQQQQKQQQQQRQQQRDTSTPGTTTSAANSIKPANAPLALLAQNSNESSSTIASGGGSGAVRGATGPGGGLRAASGANGTLPPASNTAGAGAVVDASRTGSPSGGGDGRKHSPAAAAAAAAAAPVSGADVGKPMSSLPRPASEPAAGLVANGNSSSTAVVSQPPLPGLWHQQQQSWPPPRSHSPGVRDGSFGGSGGGRGDKPSSELSALRLSEMSSPGSGLAMPGAVGGDGWQTPNFAGLASLQSSPLGAVAGGEPGQQATASHSAVHLAGNTGGYVPQLQTLQQYQQQQKQAQAQQQARQHLFNPAPPPPSALPTSSGSPVNPWAPPGGLPTVAAAHQQLWQQHGGGRGVGDAGAITAAPLAKGTRLDGETEGNRGTSLRSI